MGWCGGWSGDRIRRTSFSTMDSGRAALLVLARSISHMVKAINGWQIALSREYVRDRIGRFAPTGGGGGAGGSGSGSGGTSGGDVHANAGTDPTSVHYSPTTSTPESRGSDVMSPSEQADPKFHEALAKVKAGAADPDASDFEKNNPVAVARAYREADRPFEEIHPGGSAGLHTDPTTGKYTPERLVVHERIIAAYDAMHGQPQDHPEAIVTGGLPGSGKTSTLPKTDKTFVAINADDVKAMLPENNGVNSGWIHEESDHIVKEITRRARAARQNVIMDVTMKSYGEKLTNEPHGQTETNGLSRRIQALDHDGYHITGIFNDVPVSVATNRAMERYVKSGRFVPPDYIRSARTEGSMSTKNRQTFELLKPQLRTWKHFNNNVPKGSKPTLVASSGG